jgi:hypothetical protein
VVSATGAGGVTVGLSVGSSVRAAADVVVTGGVPWLNLPVAAGRRAEPSVSGARLKGLPDDTELVLIPLPQTPVFHYVMLVVSIGAAVVVVVFWYEEGGVKVCLSEWIRASGSGSPSCW